MLQPIRVADLNWDPATYLESLLARVGVEMSQRVAAPAAIPVQEAMAPFIPRVTVPDDPALIALIERAEMALRTPATAAAPGGTDVAAAFTASPMAPQLARIEPIARQPAGVAAEALAVEDALAAEVGLTAGDPAIVTRLVGEAGRPPVVPFDQQAAALAGIQRAIAALNAGGPGRESPPSETPGTPPNLLRERLLREWAERIERASPDARPLWPCADGYVVWEFDPQHLRGMAGAMAGEGTPGPLADIDWSRVEMADVPRDIGVAWAEQVAAWFLARTGAVLAELSERHGLGLTVVAD